MYSLREFYINSPKTLDSIKKNLDSVLENIPTSKLEIVLSRRKSEDIFVRLYRLKQLLSVVWKQEIDPSKFSNFLIDLSQVSGVSVQKIVTEIMTQIESEKEDLIKKGLIPDLKLIDQVVTENTLLSILVKICSETLIKFKTIENSKK